jgi:c-di-GMP-binding flagellar brake protein YcgR
MEEEAFDVDLSDLDARSSPRAPMFTRVELPWHLSKAVRARDISLGGMRALTRDGRVAHYAGEKVHLRFALPGDPVPLEVTARVVSQTPAGNDLALGFRFEAMSRDAVLRIYRLIKHRTSTSSQTPE